MILKIHGKESDVKEAFHKFKQHCGNDIDRTISGYEGDDFIQNKVTLLVYLKPRYTLVYPANTFENVTVERIQCQRYDHSDMADAYRYYLKQTNNWDNLQVHREADEAVKFTQELINAGL